MRSGPGAAYVRAAFDRAVPRRAPRPFAKSSPPALVHSPWTSPRLDRREDAPCASTFSGAAFAVGLLLGIVLTSAAFAGGLWWRRHRAKGRRARNRLTIDPYGAPHHIITEAAISPPATVVNMIASTTQLVSSPQSPGTARGQAVGRVSSTRSAAPTTRSAATTTRWRSSRSESSLPLPIALRDATGKFSHPPLPRNRQSELMSLFSTGDDSFLPGPHTSFALSAEPSTATDEFFPRTPLSAHPHSRSIASAPPLPRTRAGSLHSLARTAVARDSISSIGSTSSRVLAGPPPTPPPTGALPAPPSDDRRMKQLHAALAHPSSPTASQLPSSPLRPLPDSPAHPLSPSAREEKAAFLARDPRAPSPAAGPPPYSRPPSRST